MSLREPHQAGITVYHHPNPQIRSYLTEEAISSLRVEHLKSLPDGENEPNLSKLGLIGAQAAREILQIEGILEIKIKPKEVWIKKAESSSWEELEGKIMSIIGRALRKKKIRLLPRSSH